MRNRKKNSLKKEANKAIKNRLSKTKNGCETEELLVKAAQELNGIITIDVKQ